MRVKIKFLSGILAILSVASVLSVSIETPDKINLYEGEAYQYKIAPPLYKTDAQNNISAPQRLGSYSMDVKLLGIIPIKSVEVTVTPQISVIPGGQAIGMRMKSDGPMVVSSEKVSTENGEINLAAGCGIRTGDRIITVDNEKCLTTSDLSKAVTQSEGRKLTLGIVRNEKLIKIKITPQYDIKHNAYRLGIWLRDGTVGIGTVSFILPQSKIYGALGHGITDIDTGMLIRVCDGSITETNIFDVKKGRRGEAGELKGAVQGSKYSIGSIVCNTNLGVFGVLNSLPETYAQPIPVASRGQVKTGKAEIRTCVDGKSIETFEIEILRTDPKNLLGLKGMEIKITDSALLEKTGGIVQGMSGSPIIQDGKVVGAVTHVFIGDPEKGYAIYFEDMLKELNRWNIAS